MSISIRTKIIFLVALALTISLASYIYVGTSLIIGDKIAYIYDYTLTRTREVSTDIQSWVNQSVTTANYLAKTNGQEELAVFEEASKNLGMTAYLALKPLDDGKFAITKKVGFETDELETQFLTLSWTPETLRSQKMLFANAKDRLILGGFAADGTAYAAMLKLDFSLFSKNKISDVDVRVFDRATKTLLFKMGRSFSLPDAQFGALLGELAQDSSNLKQGAREWKTPAEEYIVSYERLNADRFLVVSLLPKSIAFTAAQALTTRSLALGLSTLFLAIGFALLFVRSLIARIKQLWLATQKVAAGDYKCAVEVKKGVSDELNSLATSFNSMAGKIEELMLETAQKARMEKELETAQVVQNRFFPSDHFDHGNFRLYGAVEAASECGGDWWGYSQIDNQLLVAIGDVTGHGVSAALVTAAVHGTFSTLTRKIRNSAAAGRDASISIEELMKDLNEAICAAAADQATMTFLLAQIDLDTGLMRMINASHRNPYVLTSDESNKIKPITDGKCAALGQGKELQTEVFEYQLSPGDIVFWYTDGLLECTNPEGKTINKNAMSKMLFRLIEQNKTDAKTIVESMMKESLDFFAKSDLEDDVTVLVGAIPKDAAFLKKAA